MKPTDPIRAALQGIIAEKDKCSDTKDLFNVLQLIDKARPLLDEQPSPAMEGEKATDQKVQDAQMQLISGYYNRIGGGNYTTEDIMGWLQDDLNYLQGQQGVINTNQLIATAATSPAQGTEPGKSTPPSPDIQKAAKAIQKILDLANEQLPERFPIDDKKLSALYHIKHTAKGLLAGAQHISKQGAGMRWVKCSERLPETYRRVIVRWENIGKHAGTRIELISGHQLRHWLQDTSEIDETSPEWLDDPQQSGQSPNDSEGQTGAGC